MIRESFEDLIKKFDVDIIIMRRRLDDLLKQARNEAFTEGYLAAKGQYTPRFIREAEEVLRNKGR